MEIALPYRTDAYRVVYAVQIGDAVWVLHAFQKKSTKGIATPQKELELIKSRLKRIRGETP
jgi:phage-related protein